MLVDGDMRKKKGYKRLNEGASVGLSEYLTAQAQINDIIYETTTELLYYIPCGEQNESGPSPVLNTDGERREDAG